MVSSLAAALAQGPDPCPAKTTLLPTGPPDAVSSVPTGLCALLFVQTALHHLPSPMRIVVGQGAFGEVFQARKRGTLEIYATKVMGKDKILERNHAEYMKSEKEILTKVDHPFIVQLRYSFQVREHSFCAHSQSSYRWGGKYIAILDSLQPHCRPHMLGTGAKFSRRLSRRN
jgi:hypothetical protein